MSVRFSSAEAARLYGEGWTLVRLAARYGAAPSTVGVRLRSHGVRLRPRGTPRRTALDQTDRIVLSLRAEGGSLRSIASRIGVTHQAIMLRLRRARAIAAAEAASEHLVGSATRCTSCGRGPRPGERFGSGPAEWDRPARLCPECWDAVTKLDDEEGLDAGPNDAPAL